MKEASQELLSDILGKAQRKNIFHKQKNTRQNDTTGCIKTRQKIVMRITESKKMRPIWQPNNKTLSLPQRQ